MSECKVRSRNSVCPTNPIQGLLKMADFSLLRFYSQLQIGGKEKVFGFVFTLRGRSVK